MTLSRCSAHHTYTSVEGQVSRTDTRQPRLSAWRKPRDLVRAIAVGTLIKQVAIQLLLNTTLVLIALTSSLEVELNTTLLYEKDNECVD